MSLTPISISRWTNNNPCEESGKRALLCVEQSKQDEVFANRTTRQCSTLFDEYKNCMSTLEFEKKKIADRIATSQQSIHTSGFSIFTWK